MNPETNGQTLMKALAQPFHPSEVKWKPQAVKGTRALAICYVDARCVMDRLDAVFGVGGWQTSYTPFPGGSVECRLSVFVGSEWITKADVGSPSEQPDEGDQLKAAYSDALKRAAVQFGVGRYLYRLKSQWVDYDIARKMFSRTPGLPPEALPSNPEKAAEEAGVIDSMQVEQLAILIEEKGADLDRFLKFANVESLAVIDKSDFPKLLDMLKRRKKEGAKS